MRDDVELKIGDERYTSTDGVAYLTGVQALVRLPLEQARIDASSGRRIGSLISGYPGSPLGGYDLALKQAGHALDEFGVRHVRGVNEELAAAVVWGSQLVEHFPHSRYDGVTGYWYGKAPGVDRAGDMFRHANYAGNGEHCAMVAFAADDPSAKSSSLPCGSEWALVNCGMPVLYPATVTDALRMGLHAVALSRATGMFVGLKLVTRVCDGAEVVNLGAHRTPPALDIAQLAPGFRKPNAKHFYAPDSVELERSLFEDRVRALHASVEVLDTDTITAAHPGDRFGIIASGQTHTDLLGVLADMGLDAPQLKRLGIRILKLGLIHPIAPRTIERFCQDLRDVVVVEEKRPLIEDQVKAILFNRVERPRIQGKADLAGTSLFPVHGELHQDAITGPLARVLLALGDIDGGLTERIEACVRRAASSSRRLLTVVASRMPNYCSGCPHSRSARSVDGELVGGGIGCHGMAQIIPDEDRTVAFLTPMGAEGAPWAGLEPFVDIDHISQNMGDGTYFHSGSLAVRQAVAAGSNMTFKLLFNGYVAMTGGQEATGGSDVAELTRGLEADGVRRTIVVAEDPYRHKRAALAANATVVGRDRYEESVRSLAAIEGVTVLLFDQMCAAEKRRGRKRGTIPHARKRVVINEDVCEGCGDCGAKSNCMSVQPVATELGRKTQIHQSSCNTDYSCLEGDCPSFLTVYLPEESKSARSSGRAALPPLDEIPEPPDRQLRLPYRILMPGVGGTGVVTTNQVLAYAAMLDGRHAVGLDQTGMAQKGGAVVSSLIIDEEASPMSNRIAKGAADLVLALDVQGAAAAQNLELITKDRTSVVGNLGRQPTGEEVRHVDVSAPDANMLREQIDRMSDGGSNIWLDAESIVRRLFEDDAVVNTFMVGVAYQAGYLPLTFESIERAYAINGVATERNIAAFRAGRVYVHAPERLVPAETPVSRSWRHGGADVAPSFRYARDAGAARWGDLIELLGAAVAAPIGSRASDLIDYQNERYAVRYLDTVLSAARAELESAPGSTQFAMTVSDVLYKLMAYKDEYEVARLLLDPAWQERVEEEFPGATVRFNLHPPMLRSMGLRGKLELGPWFRPVLRVLTRLRRVRGTAFDPFGRAQLRKEERQLIDWYEEVVALLVANLAPSSIDWAVMVARIPSSITGYEELKHKRIDEAKNAVTAALLDRPHASAELGDVAAPS